MCLEEEEESKSRILIDRALRGTPKHFSSCFQHSYVLTIDQRYSVKPAVLISVLKILVTSKFFVLKPTHLSNMLFFSFFFKSKFKSLAKYCLYGSVSFVTCLWTTGSLLQRIQWNHLFKQTVCHYLSGCSCNVKSIVLSIKNSEYAM